MISVPGWARVHASAPRSSSPLHLHDDMYVTGVPMGARTLRGFTVR
jgi:hypothetical protein